MIKYLLDENVADLFRTELVRREPGMIVWRIGMPGALAKGVLDPDILCWCEEFGFILVTNNRKSMPEHLAAHLNIGRHTPGILEMNPNMGIGETIEELLLIWAIADDDEYQDRIEYLPIN